MMKKLIITLAIALVAFTTNAQEFNLGLSVATPAGEASDLFSSAFILDAEYLYNISEKIKLGATTGYLFSVSNNDNINASIVGDNTVMVSSISNAGFLPVAASGRFMATKKFSFGGDVGYAFGLQPSNSENGFYFALKTQYKIKDYLHLTASFRSLTLDDNRDPTLFDVNNDSLILNYLSLGVLIKL